MIRPIQNFLSILLLTTSMAAQAVSVPVIDLTHVIARQRLREPTTASGSSSSVGYEGSILPASSLVFTLISLKRNQSNDSSKFVGELELRNTGRDNIEIPVDPSSRDLEPMSSAASYDYVKAYIWLAAEQAAGQNLPGAGLPLYGARSVPASLRTLKPGDAVRIRANIPAGNIIQHQQDSDKDPSHVLRVRAFVTFFHESVAPQKDGLHSIVEEIIPAVSSSTAVELPL
jgi:hypothetical protein